MNHVKPVKFERKDDDDKAIYRLKLLLIQVLLIPINMINFF